MDATKVFEELKKDQPYNFILTSRNGIKFFITPYDLDTTFGLHWSGLSFDPPTVSITSISFWDKFKTAFSSLFKARYAELKSKDILTETNVYRHFSDIAKIIGVEKYQEDFTKWTEIPSNNLGVTTPYGTGGCYTSVAQIMNWTKDRVIWMDSQYT